MQTALTNNYLRKTSGNIVNADINASAAIAYSKLNLANSVVSADIVNGTIVDADINAAAAIAKTKLNLTGAITSADIADGTIVNADINAAAAINTTKVAAFPYCIAYRTAAAGVLAFGAADGVMVFNASNDNTGSMWSAGSPTRITAPSAGWYRIAACAVCSPSSGTTTDGFVINKNGVTTLAGTQLTSIVGEIGVYQLAASDYVELVWDRITATVATTGLINGNLQPTLGSHYGALLVQYMGA